MVHHPHRTQDRVSRLIAPLILAGAGLAWSVSATAQQPASAAQPPASTATPATSQQAAATPTDGTAAGQNGFVIQTANGDNRIQFTAVVQTDGRFTTDEPAAVINTFAMRKIRPGIQGRIGRYFDFRVNPEFGNGTATMLDVYSEIRFSAALRVRIGKDKTPLGLELLQNDAALLFPERSLASSLVPNRDVGVQAQGDLDGARLTYAAGVFNGVPDGASSTADVDTNAGKDLGGRIVYQPFRRSAGLQPALGGLGLHLGGSTGSQTGTLPSFRTSVGQTWFSYAGATADGGHTRVTPGVFFYYKHAGVFAEYVRSAQDIRKGADVRRVTNTGWDVSGTLVLTGEAATSGTITPARLFDPPARKWGALQIVARYSELNADDDVFAGAFAASTASDTARQATFGINWYPVSYVKYYLDYERTTFTGGADRPAENVVLLRAQLAF